MQYFGFWIFAVFCEKIAVYPLFEAPKWRHTLLILIKKLQEHRNVSYCDFSLLWRSKIIDNISFKTVRSFTVFFANSI